MGYASISGRARTSASNPRAHAICDRCGFRYNHYALAWQFDWRGGQMTNTRILVCQSCMDIPNEQLRAITIPADPVPISNPRIQDFVNAETNYRVTSGQDTTDPVTGIPIPGTTTRLTEDDNSRVTQTTGEPPGGLNEQPGTSEQIPDDIGGNDPGLPYTFEEVPKTGPLGGE